MYTIFVILLLITLVVQIFLIRQDRKRIKQIKKIKQMICECFDLPLNSFDLWSDELISKMIKAQIMAMVLQKLVKDLKNQKITGWK